LSSLFYFLLILGVVFMVLLLVLGLLPKSEGMPAPELLPTPKPLATAPLGPVPPLLIWAVAIGLAGGAILLGIWMMRSRRQPAPDLWLMEAQEARDAILAGGDLKSVILRCYQRMSQALQEERHIEREVSMTTGEFQRLLTAKGIPHDPVCQLTQLFEAVRYGHWQPDADAEQRALHCLDAITEYSRSARQAG
jgi:hypothetical protein